jgi:transcriptional regulator with XRE-family HTH domain/mannose-6-phosphate isomerase-like protein (cupin superfamily)
VFDSSRSAELGESLRRIREARGLGVRELARRIDVSPSLISRIERGTVMPSVATLFALQSALDVSVAELLGETLPAGVEIQRGEGDREGDDGGWVFGDVVSHGVQRADDRKAIDLGSGVHWERLTPGPDGIHFTYNVYKPGGASSDDGTLLRHSGREYGYVIEGRLSVALEFETYVLGPGDSIAFDSSVPHRLFNDGDVDVVSIWVAIRR